MKHFRIFAAWLALISALALYAPAAQSKQVALLIGINSYSTVKPLEGAINDVQALREVLIKNWGFAPQDILTVLDKEATHARILRELGALKQRSAPGDFVFVYFSGHGTSALDTSNNLPLPHTSGAFVPVDFPGVAKLRELGKTKPLADVLADTLIVGRTHLRPVFSALEKDRKVFVMSDSCYSGNMVRSTGAKHFRVVELPLDLGADSMMASSSGAKLAGKEPVEEAYPYQDVVFLSAASDREKARDLEEKDLIGTPTLDDKPHGAFTDAVLRVLSGKVAADKDGDGKLNYAELHQAAMQFMEGREYGHTPQRLPSLAEDRTQSTLSPVFGRGIPVEGNAPPARPAAQVAVRLAASLSHLKGALQSIKGVQLVGPSDQAMLEVVQSGKEIELRAGSGDAIIKLTGADELLKRRVAAEVWWRGLVAQAKPDFQVSIETNPASRGNTFVEGEKFLFNVRSSRQASLLILNVDPHGDVSVLYPQNQDQMRQHPASKVISLPEVEKIIVTPPFGMDQVVAVSLPNTPANWYGVDKIIEPVGIDNPKIRGLEKLLSEQGGQFAWQALAVRTYPKPRTP